VHFFPFASTNILQEGKKSRKGIFSFLPMSGPPPKRTEQGRSQITNRLCDFRFV
jgi:hypothetical protein